MTIKFIASVESLRVNKELVKAGYGLVDAKPFSYLYRHYETDTEVLVLIK